MTRPVLIAATLAGVAAAALIGVTAAAAAAPPANGSRPTREYVDAAGHSDAFEIAEAQLALTESKDPQVLAFARDMIRDHGQTSAALKAATARSGLTPPPEGLGADQAPLLGALQGAGAAEFDAMYWHHQVLGHRSALTSTEPYASAGDDAAVRAAAAAALPIIRGHLAMCLPETKFFPGQAASPS